MSTKKYAAALASCSLVVLSACSEQIAPIAAANAQPAPPSVAPPPMPIPPPPKVAGKSFVLMEFASGQTLASASEQERAEPASLTKIMTAYAVFDALRQNTVRLDDLATISEYAWRSGGASTEGSTSFLPVNSRVPIEVLLRGMIVQSGNDASIALAERVAGSEEAFAQLMNAYARRLGMTGSHFQNATGLPGPEHYTTARDMALLARAIIRDFPQYYGYFAEPHYTFNNITQPNRNRLLTTGEGVDGLKTGHTKAAGYCLVSSAKRNDMRLISVVMGTASEKARESATSSLLNYGFNFFEPKPLFVKAQQLGQTRVWKGVESQVNLATSRDVVIAVPRGRAAHVQAQVQVPTSVLAPVAANTQIGAVNITLDGKVLLTEPLYTQAAIEQAGFFGRMWDSVWMQFE